MTQNQWPQTCQLTQTVNQFWINIGCPCQWVNPQLNVKFTKYIKHQTWLKICCENGHCTTAASQVPQPTCDFQVSWGTWLHNSILSSIPFINNDRLARRIRCQKKLGKCQMSNKLKQKEIWNNFENENWLVIHPSDPTFRFGCSKLL